MPSAKVTPDMICPLKLSLDEMQMIIDDAERILTETLAAHELFVSNGRSLPQDRFKLAKTKENIQVYRSRKLKHSSSTWDRSLKDKGRSRTDTAETTLMGSYDFTASSSSSTLSSSSVGYKRVTSSASTSSDFDTRSESTTSSSSTGSSSSSHGADSVTPCDKVSVEINRSKPVDRPLVIATGIIGGTVDDVAFGMLAHTERLWRHRDAHMADQYAAAKILATITRPTPQSPFNSLTVKWSAKSVGALARMRDCVYIEANGVATDARGERVAYSLVHSLDSLPRIPGFKHLDVVRVNQSTCYLSRQHDQSSVEVFCRGFADQGGNFSDGCANTLYADMVLSIVHVVDCAYVRKLVWLAHKKRELRYMSGAPLRTAAKGSLCANCGATFNALTSLIGCATPCQACSREVCCKCSVSKKVPMETTCEDTGSYGSSEAKLKSVVFCLHCVIEATRTPTQEVASSVLLGDDVISIGL